ncbi:hypothetical protein RU86_GL001362 [Lactococcus piscium]|uniref:Uncharacterized protein n=2 Tax=Pseudolactococcus piscium TaxID=1364 RepID=A0A2A5RUR2_9LACT|nr:hypothetical protein RU86_GL001362 [Lactococcus piscium]
MFKKMGLGLIGIILVIGGVLLLKQPVKTDILKELGQKQTLRNQTSEQKDVIIDVSGYYDVTTLKGQDGAQAISRLPTVGQTLVGQFFDKGESVQLASQQEVEMKPAKFAKLDVKNKAVKLTNGGSYLVGKQFPAGTYKISLNTVLPEIINKRGKADVAIIQGGVYSPEKPYETEAFELSNDKMSTVVKLENDKLLAIKSPVVEISLTLEINK